MNKRILTSVGLALVLLLFALGGASAAPMWADSPPGRMTYQGHLLDETGNPVPDGSYAMTFALYDAPSAGNLLWGAETHTVDVDDGYFTALLGRDDPIEAGDLDTNTYLEITVGGETMTPRHRLTSVAFALVAQQAISCTGALGSGDAWLIGGNSGLSAPELGTTDAQTVTVVVSGADRVSLGTQGQTAIGSNVSAAADYATVGGGQNNTASGDWATIGGGGTNHASGIYAVLAGGTLNEASGDKSTVGGGQSNDATAMYATVGGGYNNTASETHATVGGGGGNTAINFYATVAGGQNNDATAEHSFVGGGYGNVASDDWSAVCGGYNNEAYYTYAFVGGGRDNLASGGFSTVGGGNNNTASGYRSTVGGGYNNTASGGSSTVGGGQNNTASGGKSTVGGGNNNTASGDYSLAGGQAANAIHNGAWVWGDSSTTPVSSTASNQFVAQAGGGAVFYSASNLSSGATLPAGSGSWASLSDRDSKMNIAAIDTAEILSAVGAISITQWAYNASSSTLHIGPMAQDFYAAFGYGDSDRYISSVDADGVSLAAIQALLERVEALEAQVAALEARVEALE
jgi:hypothetical protein